MLRRGHRVHLRRPGLGPVRRRASPASSAISGADLVGVVVVPAAAELEPLRAGRDARVRRRLDRRRSSSSAASPSARPSAVAAPRSRARLAS